MVRRIPDRNRAEAEATARACMARSGWKRLALSRLFEFLLRPLATAIGRQRGTQEGEPKTILVVEYWRLGDVVMLTPFMKTLRRQYPRTRIVLLANPNSIPLLDAQEWVDEVITVRVPWAQHDSRLRKYISRHWLELLRCMVKLRVRNFDWGFSARADIRDNFILWAVGVKRRLGYGYGYGASLLTDVVTPDISKPHFSDRWLHLLEYLGKPVLDRQPQLDLTVEEKTAARRYLFELGIRETEVVIGVHAGARNPIRQWGENNFLEVAKKLAARFPIKVIWFQEARSTQFGRDSEGWLIPVTLSLRKFLGVLAHCRLLVCNDTGPMHLATALGVPVVAVFGATMPAWWGPRGEGSQIVLHEGIWCRPCGDRCHFNEPYCLRAVSIERVLTAAEGTVAKINSRACGATNQLIQGS